MKLFVAVMGAPPTTFFAQVRPSEQIAGWIGALRLHSVIMVPPKRILRVAGARPLPFAAIVGRDGGAASIRQPQYADAMFPCFPILIDRDAAIRLERYHVNECISVRQVRRRAVNEVVKVGPNARGFCRAVVALDDRRKNSRHSLSPTSHRTRASATCPLALARKKPKGGRLSLRAIAAELAARGFLNERGRPFNPKSVAAILAS